MFLNYILFGYYWTSLENCFIFHFLFFREYRRHLINVFCISECNLECKGPNFISTSQHFEYFLSFRFLSAKWIQLKKKNWLLDLQQLSTNMTHWECPAYSLKYRRCSLHKCYFPETMMFFPFTGLWKGDLNGSFVFATCSLC